MRIHILSDLHNEFDQYQPAQVEADVLILAGDIDLRERGVKWAADAFPGIEHIIYTPGNHEYYGGSLGHTLSKIRAAAGRVHVLDLDEIVIEGVRFLGATSFTNYRVTGNPAAAARVAQMEMSDFKKIRNERFGRVHPVDFINIADQSYDWLAAKLQEAFQGPTVVITHHAPALVCLQHGGTHGSELDGAYSNDWNDLIDSKADLWIYGHTHESVDFQVGSTRVVSNQRGYPGEQARFQPDLVVTLEHEK
jgi:predicted phosphodiesterase